MNPIDYYTEKFYLDYSRVYPNRKIKYPELANILQITAANHADFGGLGFDDLQQNNQAWVMNRIRIEIDTLPELNDEVSIDTWLELLRGPKSIRNLEVKKDGRKLIGVSSLWAVFNTERRRPEALKIASDHLQRFPDLHATSVENQKIETPENFEKVAEYQVKLSDLDVVNHVNNIQYLTWCLDTLPKEEVLDRSITVLEMNFLKELSYQKTIRIEQHRQEKDLYLRICDDQFVYFIAKITYK